MEKSKPKYILLIVALCTMFSCAKQEIRGTVTHHFANQSGYGVFEYVLENNDTVLDGSYKVYDKANRLIKEGTNVNNEMHGPAKFYYPSGNVQSIRYYKHDKEIGEKTWYYPNGNPERYSFYDDLDNLNFFIIYDSLGKPEKWKGMILFETYQYKLAKENKNRYKLGDEVEYHFMFPNIPDTEREFHFKLLDFENSKIDRTVEKIEPVTLVVKEKAVKKGRNTIKASIQYSFRDESNMVLSSSISFSYFVE